MSDSNGKIDVDKVSDELSDIVKHFGLIGGQLTNAANYIGANSAQFVKQAPLGKTVDTVSTVSKAFDALEADIKKVREQIAKIKEVYIPEKFDDEEISSFNTDDFRITRTRRIYASILDQEAAFEWLEKNDLGALIKPTVNSSALSGAAKEQMENGKELPDDIFRTYAKNGVSITVKRKSRG